jgi:hypothetical protein
VVFTSGRRTRPTREQNGREPRLPGNCLYHAFISSVSKCHNKCQEVSTFRHFYGFLWGSNRYLWRIRGTRGNRRSNGLDTCKAALIKPWAGVDSNH